jgi:hypothetical protein
MSNQAAWAAAIKFAEGDGQLSGNVLRHVRDAVREAGYVSRGRITSGIKEAYRPLGLDETALRTAIGDALRLMMCSGDIDELSTGAGRGYAPTPPRRITWGGLEDAVLGNVEISSSATVRRIASTETGADLISVPLVSELGRPAWRDALLELGGSDAPDGDARVLADFARALTGGGERYVLDEPSKLVVLSGRGQFYGQPEGPSGRWARAEACGFFPAIIESGFSKRHVCLVIEDGLAMIWEPPSRDVWRWIVVGVTLDHGDPVWRYETETHMLQFLTPPPRQAERAALLVGEQVTPWSWCVNPAVQEVIANLLGRPRLA